MKKRAGAWWGSWRSDPWDLISWREQNRLYQVWVLAQPIAALAVLATIVHMSQFTANVDLGLLLGSLALTTFLGVHVFRTAAELSINPGMFVPIVLVMSAHPVEAIVCAVMLMTVSSIRKPIHPHLWVLNSVDQIFSLGLASAAFALVVGDAAALSPRWVLSCFVVGVTISITPIFATFPTLVLGKYQTVREVARAARADLISELTVFTPQSLVIAGFVAQPTWWYLLFAAIPFAFYRDLFATADALVDAKEEAQLDPLTGLRNRRALTDSLDRLLDEARGTEKPSWVILCDLDNFKRLNDTHGHDMGDEALRRAAKQFQSSVRPIDTCARYGGEEFVLLLSALHRGEALMVAERVRNSIERDLSDLQTTVSIGVYQLNCDDDPLTALSRADHAMYNAKTSGKNQVVVWADTAINSESTHLAS